MDLHYKFKMNDITSKYYNIFNNRILLEYIVENF